MRVTTDIIKDDQWTIHTADRVIPDARMRGGDARIMSRWSHDGEIFARESRSRESQRAWSEDYDREGYVEVSWEMEAS